MPPKFIVAMLGGRMYWAVPRKLHAAGWLERYYTDFSALKGWPRLLGAWPDFFRPPAVHRLLGRAAPGVPASSTTAFNNFGLEYARRLRRSRSATETTAAFLWAGQEFCRRILTNGLGTANAVFTYNSAGLELLQMARRQGLKTVMEQTIAPMQIERELLAEERARFPCWETAPGRDDLADEYIQREAAEWQAADLVLCGSEFVRAGIRNSGGPVEKCAVVPYGVANPGALPITNLGLAVHSGPLRVLTVGAVGLRKGSPYVLEVAKRLKQKAVFRMVGGIGVTREAEAQLRSCVELTGPVPRSQIARHFEWADVFFLPSICEGSATATYEALAHGLPVVCTPNTGSVVRDGKEGFLVAVRAIEEMTAKLESLADAPNLLQEFSQNARTRSREYSFDAYGQRLLETLSNSLL